MIKISKIVIKDFIENFDVFHNEINNLFSLSMKKSSFSNENSETPLLIRNSTNFLFNEIISVIKLNSKFNVSV